MIIIIIQKLMKFNCIIILAFLIFQISTRLFPHIIWMYWDIGYKNMQSFQRSCFQVVQKLHANTDWEIRFVDNTTIEHWFSKQTYSQLKTYLNPDLKVTKQTRANFIRYYLLLQHGGVWIDVSVILHQNLDWLDHLKDNPYVLNKQISQTPQLFVFYKYETDRQKGAILHNGKYIYPRLFIQNSVIAAVKGSQFLKDLLKIYGQVIKKQQPQYNKLARQYNVPYGYNGYFRAFISSAVTVYKKYYEYTQASKQKRKTFKFHRIWSMSRQIGLYFRILDVKTFAFTFQQQYVRGDHARYLTKINHFGYQQRIERFFKGGLDDIYNVSMKFNESNYKFGLQNVKKQHICLYESRIYQNSVMNKYLLSKINARQYFPHIVLTKDSQLPTVCQYTTLQTLHQIGNILIQAVPYSYQIFIIVQFIIQFLFFVFKFSQRVDFKQKINQAKQDLKTQLLNKILILLIFYFQFESFQASHKLLQMGSPTAHWTIILESILCAILFHQLIFTNWKRQKYLRHIPFALLICSILGLKYFAQYNFTVWQYEGPIYDYERISYKNLQYLKTQEKRIAKLIVFIVCSYIFKIIKQIFKFYYLTSVAKQTMRKQRDAEGRQQISEFEHQPDNFHYNDPLNQHQVQDNINVSMQTLTTQKTKD